MTEAGNDVVIPREGVHDDGSTSAVAPVETRLLEVWLPILVVVVDQLTKALVRTKVPLYSSVTIVPGFLNLTHVLNTGAAFGIFNASDFPFKTVVIAVIATVALIFVGLYAARMGHHQFVARLGLALIIGGAAGNLLDRIVAGSVVDFVDVYWQTHHFWAFNVADSAITVGVVVMILDMLGTGVHVSKTV
jgi:signal peptidase II